jgi:hypothetical protein
VESLDALICKYAGKSISLVGGAQSIYSNEYGSEIDASDVVLRMNRNFPKSKIHQGKKTDLLAISCGLSWWKHFRYYDLAPILWMSPKRDSIPFWMKKRDNFYYYNVCDWKNLSCILQNNRPSTGAMALDFIVKYLRPAKLSLFGFDFKKTKTLYEKKQKVGPHNWALEQSHTLQIIESAKTRGLDWNIFL